MTVESITDTAMQPVDGRTRRRRRNVDAVVDAVIELAGNGNLDPTSEEIAALAGISHRSIYRYFDTRADLLEAAVARAFETASAEVLGREPSGGSFDERVEHFVSARLEICRRLRSIVRVVSIHSPEASGGLGDTRSALRDQLAEQFAEEFERVAGDDRDLAVPIVDAVFQFEALEYLRASAGLDDEAIRRSLVVHLHRHLGVVGRSA